MPAPKSSSGRSARPRSRKPATRSARSNAASTGKRKQAGGRTASDTASSENGTLAEQLANRIIKPLDLVIISRERIQQTLDEAAERGRVTRADANDLVAELVNRGRAQTDDLLKDLERMLDRGRGQIESATRKVRTADSVDLIVRGADRARRT